MALISNDIVRPKPPTRQEPAAQELPRQDVMQHGGLGQTQMSALAAVQAGRSLAEAAQEAGVGRTTIYRWLREDPQFRAAYNAWKEEKVVSAQSRLLALADKAVGVIDAALEKQDPKTAVVVLRQLGVLRRSRRGSADPEVLGLQMELGKKKAKQQAEEAMSLHLLHKVGFSNAEAKRFLRGKASPELLEQIRKGKLAEEAKSLPAPDADGTDPEESDGTGDELYHENEPGDNL